MGELEFPKMKKKKVIPTFVEVKCPDCSKPRLLKEQYEDGEVEEISLETYKAPDGSDRLVDICQFCRAKYTKRDQQFLRKEIIKLQKAAKIAQDEDSDELTDIEL